MTNEVKVEFAPGAFDGFEGTQEELDELIAEIYKMVESGELLENSIAIDFDDLAEEDPELAEKLMANMENAEHRKLQ
jgi:hypothetical protein